MVRCTYSILHTNSSSIFLTGMQEITVYEVWLRSANKRLRKINSHSSILLQFFESLKRVLNFGYPTSQQEHKPKKYVLYVCTPQRQSYKQILAIIVTTKSSYQNTLLSTSAAVLKYHHTNSLHGNNFSSAPLSRHAGHLQLYERYSRWFTGLNKMPG